MPHYDYVCDACGHELELFQSMSESAKRKCPKCKKLKFRRLIGTGAGVIFKGSGFYETDYRSESYKKGEKDSKAADKKSTEGAKEKPKAGDKAGSVKDKGAGKTEKKAAEPKPGKKSG